MSTQYKSMGTNKIVFDLHYMDKNIDFVCDSLRVNKWFKFLSELSL